MKFRSFRLMQEIADPSTDGGEGANGGAVAPPEPPPAAAEPSAQAAPSQPQAADPTNDLHWMKGRLEQHERQVLRDLGFESKDEAQAAADLTKKQAEDRKSLETKLAERDAKLAELNQTNESYRQALTDRAAVEFGTLTDQQKAAVTNLAGDDPHKVLTTIQNLKPTWAAAPARTPEPPKPANSSAASKLPSGAVQSNSPVDHAAKMEELRKTNPLAAAQYRFANKVGLNGG